MARDGLSASRGRNLRKHRGGQRRRLVVLLRDASRQAPSPQVQAVQGSRSQDRVLPRNLGVAVEVDAPAGRSTALPVLTDEPEQAGEPFFLVNPKKAWLRQHLPDREPGSFTPPAGVGTPSFRHRQAKGLSKTWKRWPASALPLAVRGAPDVPYRVLSGSVGDAEVPSRQGTPPSTARSALV